MPFLRSARSAGHRPHALPRTAPTRFDVGAGSGVAELVPGCLARTDPLIALLPAPNLAGVGPGQGTVQIDLAFGPDSKQVR